MFSAKKCHNVTFFTKHFKKVSQPKTLDFIGFLSNNVQFCDVFTLFSYYYTKNNVITINLYINRKLQNFCHKRHRGNFRRFCEEFYSHLKHTLK